MSTDTYRTLGNEGHAVLREKASRFLAWAFPIGSEEQFKERVAGIAREHHGANHVCHAWVLGPGGERHRSNDDGEPAGTAGRPILNRIRSAGITDCAVVAVRYFGGTLLGKAGLIAAYGGAAALALQNAHIVERVLLERVRITCTYAQLEAVRSSLLAAGGALAATSYNEACALLADLPRSRVDALLAVWRSQGIIAARQEVVK